MPEFFRTIAFRLTLWYSGIFSVSACVAFVLFYHLAAQTLQAQIDRELLEKAGYFATAIQRSGLMGASNLAVIEAQAAGEKVMFFRLLYPSGEVFASSHMSYWKDVAVDRDILGRLLQHRSPVFHTLAVGAKKQKARVLYTFVARNVVLQTGLVEDAQSKFLSAFKLVFFVAMGFIVLFSAVSGWFLVRKALARVDLMTRTVNSITGARLEKRLPETGSKDELDNLALTFNRMLNRIEELVRSIREMSDNIAHDLKSPVTRIRGFAELALVQEDDLDGFRGMAANTIEESDRLLDMINTMLVISRAQAGQEDFMLEPMDLSRMVRTACDLFVPLAEDKHIRFDWRAKDPLWVTADLKLIQRSFSNLLDNAIKYTPQGGRVRVETDCDNDGWARVRVSDTGPGIDPKLLEKVFERFYRAESSRTTPGTGLGLCLARTIAREHGGDVTVDSVAGKGSVFTLTLPHGNFEVI